MGEVLPSTRKNYLVNVNNDIQIERGFYGIMIDPSKYNGSEPVSLDIIGE